MPKPAYYLVESNGVVRNFGSASFYGSKQNVHLPSPIVAAALTPDDAGYWLVTAKGNVFNYGDALFLGSPVHQSLASPIIAITPTPDGDGYWVVDQSGQVFNYGDAPNCGEPAKLGPARSVIGISSTEDGQGYWLAGKNGAVYNFGDADFFGSAVHLSHRPGFVGFAATPDGLGYWLMRSNGALSNFGDARFFGSAVHKRVGVPFGTFARSPDGLGYWLTTTNGRIFNFGDAGFDGSLAHTPPPTGVSVVAFLASSASGLVVPALPHHVFGYDISNFQCTKPSSNTAQNGLPPSSSISVLEAAGWLDDADNPCLSSEASWARQASGTTGAPYELYLFLNAPDTTAAARSLDATGPRGTCSGYTGSLQAECIAYNYGYNGARASYVYASAVGVRSLVWWVDVENALLSRSAYSNFSAGLYWSDSTTLNAETIQGAIDALRAEGVMVGIYSTSVQFPKIAGNFVPSGAPIPLWVAGVPWTKPPYSEAGLLSPSSLATWCAGTAIYAGSHSKAAFAGGVPWILQETPGSIASPYNLDPDYTC